MLSNSNNCLRFKMELLFNIVAIYLVCLMSTVPNQNSENTDPLSEDRLLTIDLGKDRSLDSQSCSSVNDAENRTESEEAVSTQL